MMLYYQPLGSAARPTVPSACLAGLAARVRGESERALRPRPRRRAGSAHGVRQPTRRSRSLQPVRRRTDRSTEFSRVHAAGPHDQTRLVPGQRRAGDRARPLRRRAQMTAELGTRPTRRASSCSATTIRGTPATSSITLGRSVRALAPSGRSHPQSARGRRRCAARPRGLRRDCHPLHHRRHPRRVPAVRAGGADQAYSRV